MYSLLFQTERLVSAHGGDSIRQADTFSDLLFKKFPHSCLLYTSNGSRFLELFWNRYQQERQTALWSGRVAELSLIHI